VVNAEVDSISGQPEFKHTPVRIVPYAPAWHGFLLSRRKLELTDTSYWSRAIGDGFYHYEIAGEQETDDWPAWARKLLCASEPDTNWVEYLDKGLKQYRGVRLVSDRVESCIFIAPSHQLPSRSWLEGLFVKQALDDVERKGLLSGRAPAGQKDQGRVICACFQIGVNTITDAILTQGLTTLEEIGNALRAGTNCGSCVPEIRELLGITLSKKLS
jgi:assimilatory nitrate reductase catalytic subunit